MSRPSWSLTNIGIYGTSFKVEFCFRQKISSLVPHRVLIPSLGRCYTQLIEEGKFKPIGPLLMVLADSLTGQVEVNRLLPDLTPFFMKALEVRSDAEEEKITISDVSTYIVGLLGQPKCKKGPQVLTSLLNQRLNYWYCTVQGSWRPKS